MNFQAESSILNPSESVVANAAAENMKLEANDALRDGIKAAQSGDRGNARTALLRATALDPHSESAWLWLASISEYPEELLVFLNNVLEINPLNGRANEWMKATKSLLSKTFVQRGIDAADGGLNEFAVQCFDQALEHDQTNTAAWFWLADLCPSSEGKLSYLEKVLEIDPTNETARSAHQAAKDKINQGLLAEARAAAVSGRKSDAHELLDAFIAENPDSEDGWTLRSHLADGFPEKIAAFEKVLSINPNNLAARSGLDSLKAIMETVAPAVTKPASEPVEEMVDAPQETMENTAFAIDQERSFESEAVQDKNPTQELVFPLAASEMNEPPVQEFETAETATTEPTDEEPSEEVVEAEEEVVLAAEEPVEEEAVMAAEVVEETPEAVEPEKPEAVDWSMNTVAFTFAFPGGEASETAETDDVPVAMEAESFDFSVNGSNQVSEADDDQLIETVTADQEVEPVYEASPAAVTKEYSFKPADAAPGFEPVLEEYKVEEAPALSGQYTFVPVEEAVVEPVHIFEPSIPMPESFDVEPVFKPTGYETRIVREQPAVNHSSGSTVCPFCKDENPGQAFTCVSCLATLTLADLEMLLANTHADKAILRAAVDKMESDRNRRELTESELTTLGIGHLNLRNLHTGYQYLYEASQLNPNNVVLASQVNSLLIRLEEIRQKEEAQDAMPKGRTILVVDDSATVRKLIAGKLEKCGHEVFCAADGVEAIEQLNTVKPDLILLDITMPRMDGYQVCKVIRGQEAIKDIPVVMISGKDGFFDKVRGRMAGSTGYITKPFGPETLMKAVETYLKGEES